jgi:hypothetical protein
MGNPSKIALELSDAERQALAAVAERLSLPIEALATAAVRDLLAQPADDFEQAAQRVLQKNHELYRRLA